MSNQNILYFEWGKKVISFPNFPPPPSAPPPAEDSSKSIFKGIEISNITTEKVKGDCPPLAEVPKAEVENFHSKSFFYHVQYIFIVCFAIVLFSSCGSSSRNAFFVQHEANTLKLKKEKDLIVTGGLLSSTNVNFLGNSDRVKHDRTAIQAAYSPVKYLGVFGLHSRLKSSNPSVPSEIYHKSHVTGGGVGTYYYFKFHQRPPHKVLPGRPIKYTKILFDLYGGYTYGKLDNIYFLPPADATMNYQKFYLQGGIHWEGTFWSLSYVHKWGKTNFSNGIINGQTNSGDDLALLAILNKNNLYFQEGSLRLEAKSNGIGIYGQTTFADIQEFGFRSIPDTFFHFGLVINIFEAKKHFTKNRKKTKA